MHEPLIILHNHLLHLILSHVKVTDKEKTGLEQTMKQYLCPEWLFIPDNHSDKEQDNTQKGIPFQLDDAGFIDFD